MAEVMPQLMAKRGYARILSHDDFNDVWLEVSGPLGRFSRPGRMRRGVLEIIVSNSAVMQELNFGKRRLLKALQAKLPDQKLSGLKFTIQQV